MSDVFISYKRRLRPQVERIATALRELRVDVWFDAALEPGVSFSAEISHEVRNAGCVLVCWSNDAFPHGGDENGWVLGEASIGRKRGRLVTVMLEDTEFDPPWNMIHTERLVGFDPGDFTADRSGWRGMLAAVGRLIERPGLADYDRAIVAGSADALKGWAQSYQSDPLAEGVWAKVEEIELATVRKRLAEERVKPAPAPVQAAAPPPAQPERVYAPLPEMVVEQAAAPQPTAPAPQPAPTPDATPAAKPAPVPYKSPLSPRIAIVLATILCVIGAYYCASGIGFATEGELFNTVVFGAPLAGIAVIAIALVLSGYLNLWRAIVLVVVGYVGYYLSLAAAAFLTTAAPSFGTKGADIAGGFTMGALGAVFVLFPLVLLTRNPNLGRLIPIALSGILLVGIVTAVTMSVPSMSLHNGNVIVWAALEWYAAMGLVLVWLVGRPATA
jgi:hypothetical protein